MTVTAESNQQSIRSATAAYHAGEYRNCVERFDDAIKQGVRQPDIFYSAACCCALDGQIDKAFRYLEHAIENGYRNVSWLKKDTDLQSLRNDPRWPNLVDTCAAINEKYLQTINRELFRLFQEDQDERMSDDLDWSAVHKHDAERRVRVREMLDSGQVIVSDDYFHAAMIFQHGDDTISYLLARTLALKAVELDATNHIAAWLSAAAQDRYLWHIGKPQWYGTQTHMIDGKWTIEPIDTAAVTDEERLESHVPPLAQSRQRMEQLNESENK